VKKGYCFWQLVDGHFGQVVGNLAFVGGTAVSSAAAAGVVGVVVK
jgi:hypothetical protein